MKLAPLTFITPHKPTPLHWIVKSAPKRFFLLNLHNSKKVPIFALQTIRKGSYQSGQMGLTVTQLAYAFGGSNPSLPTNIDPEIAEVAQLIEH